MNVAFVRRSLDSGREVICVCNFSAVPKKSYNVELFSKGDYDLIINTDAEIYGGNNAVSVNNSEIDLPPLTTVWFASRRPAKKSKPRKSTKKKTGITSRSK